MPSRIHHAQVEGHGAKGSRVYATPHSPTRSRLPPRAAPLEATCILLLGENNTAPGFLTPVCRLRLGARSEFPVNPCWVPKQPFHREATSAAALQGRLHDVRGQPGLIPWADSQALMPFS
jgi:hypothetical protein